MHYPRIREMARTCEVCGKGSQIGNRVEIRGKAKYLGGVGTKVTGITRRQFRPNLQRVKIALDGGGARTVRVCAQCLRSGAVRKAVKHAPFRLTPADTKAASK
jgi:large subunit ribosomal protein L28